MWQSSVAEVCDLGGLEESDFLIPAEVTDLGYRRAECVAGLAQRLNR